MAENVCPNKVNSVDRKRKPRFSLPANDRTVQQLGRNPSSSFLLQTSSETSPLNSPGNSSSDGEWARFQAALNESKEQSKMLEESDSDVSFEDEDDDSVARVLTFESSPVKKRMSIGTINNERSEIALMKRDMELDEEIADLNAQQDAMEYLCEKSPNIILRFQNKTKKGEEFCKNNIISQQAYQTLNSFKNSVIKENKPLFIAINNSIKQLETSHSSDKIKEEERYVLKKNMSSDLLEITRSLENVLTTEEIKQITY